MKNPKTMGIIHSIIRFVDCCCGLVAAVGVIFCMSHIEPPTSTGSRKGNGFSLEYFARSIQRKEPSMGTSVCRPGIQEYSFPARSARFSGVDVSVPRRAYKRPINIGNCIIIGPRHPNGFTPCSL